MIRAEVFIPPILCVIIKGMKTDCNHLVRTTLRTLCIGSVDWFCDTGLYNSFMKGSLNNRRIDMVPLLFTCFFILLFTYHHRNLHISSVILFWSQFPVSKDNERIWEKLESIFHCSISAFTSVLTSSKENALNC